MPLWDADQAAYVSALGSQLAMAVVERGGVERCSVRMMQSVVADLIAEHSSLAPVLHDLLTRRQFRVQLPLAGTARERAQRDALLDEMQIIYNTDVVRLCSSFLAGYLGLDDSGDAWFQSVAAAESSLYRDAPFCRGASSEPAGSGRDAAGRATGLDLRRADLVAHRLERVSLRAADLRWVHLRGRDLRGRDLSMADLSDANFSGAELRKASLHQACLRNAIFIGAYLSEACLREASLVGADFSAADLIGASLVDADCAGARFVGADFCQADLSGADLSAADLSRAVLRGANLMGVSFDASTRWPALDQLSGALNLPPSLKRCYGAIEIAP